MVQIRTKVTLRRRGNVANHIAKIDKAVQGPKAVKVGFPKGKADADVVSYAIFNHFGTAGRTPRRGGWGGPIPARPFITVAMFKNRREIRAALRKIAKVAVENGTPLSVQMPKLGELGAGMIQATIAKGLPPANAELTIKLKGSGKNTLNNEGRMRQSTTWALDK